MSDKPDGATDEQWANKHFRAGYCNTWDWTGDERPIFGKQSQAMWDAGVRLRSQQQRERAKYWQFANVGKGMRAEDV